MSNLKGSSFARQIKDLQIRLEARGTKKATSNHKTHSNAQATKRDMYIKDFAQYAEWKEWEGKLNQLLTQENINVFLEARLEGLSLQTMENYISGWNSLLNGLEEVNITHSIPENYLTSYWHEIKDSWGDAQPSHEARGLGDRAEQVIEELYEKRYESGLIAELQHDLGFRVSEAMEIASNPEKYIHPLPNGDYEVSGVVGKGGHIYHEKMIDAELVGKLHHAQDIPSLSTYHRDLEAVGDISSHNFRYDFAKNLYEKLLDDGIGHHQALKEVSEEMNHHRESISMHYIGNGFN
ncbi:MAG: hypothetical protein PHV10_07035 [Sulfuricurvum sp.]|nr:hypothetical protein [Sulfuricurvum sp.]MDD3770344.1 hypothetical protein [Sulfuricurvum sp.]